MSPKQEDERDRPSWREIDKMREKPGRRREPRKPKVPKTQAEWARKQALKEAEALFQGKRGRPEYQSALQELEAHHGTKKFAGTAKKFLEEYGLPAEWGPLNRLLDYPEPEVVTEVLLAMAGQIGERSRVEQQGFKGRLQILMLTSPHLDLRRCAEEILHKI